MSESRPVIVGVDGSSASIAAIAYAARLAEQRSAALHLVHVQQYPLPGYTMVGFLNPGDPGAESVEDEMERNLRVRAERIRRDHPGLIVRAEQISGAPAAVLIARSRIAALTVLGSRGHGGFTGLLLGSVAAQVAAHASGVVVIVPVDVASEVQDRADGPVALGYDGSPGAERAMRFAAGEARLRGKNLTLTRLYDPVVDHEGMYAAMTVRNALKVFADEFPDVVIDATAIPSDNVALSLVDISQTAGLTVVGSRGHGGFSGVLLGSVGRTVLNHAHGPVAVVHAA